MVSDPRVRKITFTGSRDVGEHICRTAGLKKVTMELGSNSPVIIMPDADMNKVTTALASTGYAHAGQVCISTQRVYANREIYGDFLDAFADSVKGITTGDPRQEGVRMGPMIRESDAIRVEEWVQEAVAGGARLVAGGQRNGTLMAPTLLADVKPEMRISCDEVFGPAVGVTPVGDIDESDCPGQQHELRPEHGDLHREPGLGDEVRAGGRGRQHPHQLGYSMAGRPDALRRPERQRDGQGRPEIRRRRDDRDEDGRLPYALGGA